MTFLTILLATLIPTAHAGKLAGGFRGLPFGDAAVLDKPPMPSCTASHDQGVKWECPATIAGKDVTVDYMAGSDLYFGVVILAQGYSDASAIFATLQAGWGKGHQDNQYDNSGLPDWHWRDGPDVAATFTYNEITDAVAVVISDLTVFNKAEKLRKQEAASNVESDL